ncbi:transcriptional regulator [Streptomyces sp. NPDC050504]|uniref:transcriptional regulator n=1 Tax=Streptomyces sp. NPDC050504 TaxID=3365618 RepID=UPI0037AA9E78
MFAARGDRPEPRSDGKAVVVSDRPSGTPAPRTPSRTPSPGGAAASAKPSGTPREVPGTPSASREAERESGSGGRGEAENGEAPLSVAIRSYNYEAPCGQFYLLDRAPSEVPPPPTDGGDSRGWGREQNAVAGGAMKLEFAVQGKSEKAVVLRDLHVRVVERGEPLAHNGYLMGNGCGSGLTPAYFDVPLDRGAPTAVPKAGENMNVKVPARPFPFKVSSSDPEVIDVDVHTEKHDVRWYLELEWSSGDQQGVVRIDDGGRPFRTSSVKGRPQFTYAGGESGWEPYEWADSPEG